MLRLLAPLALLVPLTADAQPLPRVGAEIDGAEERAYQSGSASGLLYRWESFSGPFPVLDVFVGIRLHF